jgi:hypothetical protein
MTTDAWMPANGVERQLRDAVDAGDPAEVMRILAVAPLVLPGFRDDPAARADDPRQRLLTRERDGAPYLLVFTSVEAMQRTVTAEGWRATTLPELVRAWPHLAAAQPWGLAINPATPVGVLVAPADVPTLVPTPAALAPFVPANEVERLLRDALAAPDGEVLLDVLVTSQMVVPTRGLVVDEVPTVAVFTSAQRCEEYLHTVGIEAPTVALDFVEVLRQWPGAGHRLTVNPGSLIEFSLSGDRVPDLLAYAAGLVHRRLGDREPPEAADPEPPPDPPPLDDIADLLRGRG